MSSDGRLTGAFLPVGVPAEPGMEIAAKVPCGGSIMRVAFERRGDDGLYAHEDMEVYAFGFRNQSGVAFGPEARALRTRSRCPTTVPTTSATGASRAHPKSSSSSPMGQDAGCPDKEGFLFVDAKRYGWTQYEGNPVQRPHPQLYIGEEPWGPEPVPYHFQAHVDGVRGVPRIIANPNPEGYINPVLEWDTNNPIDGIAWSASGFGRDNHLFGAVFGILDTGPESIAPTWPAVLDIEFLEPAGVKWSYFARNVEMGPNAYHEPENKGGLERRNDVVFANDGRTMYVVDYGEVFTDFTMPTPFYTEPGSGVIWTITRTGGRR